MKNLDSALLCLEIDSIALGYRALNILCDAAKDELRVIDASPIGERFLILALADEKVLKDSLARARTDIEATHTASVLDAEVFTSASSEILEAMFSLQQTPLEESLVVAECESVSGCLATALTLVEGHGLKPIEIKIHRSNAKGAYAFFTGNEQACLPAAEDAKTRLKNALREGTIEVIAQPTKTFRGFFQLSGES